jgi:hemerythrin
MNADKSKQKLYFITLNLHRKKHAELIEWIKSVAEKDEQSLSSLCIKLLKQCMVKEKGDDK